jgi:RNA-directed DNA polymerase
MPSSFLSGADLAVTDAHSETPAMPAFPAGQLITSEDAAAYLDVRLNELIYILYRAPDDTRYRHFEIPKRSGGTRLISSPNGLLRDWQQRLAAVFQDLYDAHPAAHGFIRQRSVVTNAAPHAGQRHVLNVDLKEFFPTINFGRVRGLFMNPPFSMGPKAATIFAQICTYKNGLPQGAPTSPVLSNFVAAQLDRRLLRLAKQNNVTYTRYADDISFSTNRAVFPPSLALTTVENGPITSIIAGEALEEAVQACGFAINAKKVRLQSRAVRQSVTGVTVNTIPNVERGRIRQLRAMLHAWGKFGLDAAAQHHFASYKATGRASSANPGAAFRNIVYGHLAYVKMVRGQSDPVFLKLCAKIIPLDPNPSKFVRQMVFGAEAFDLFISHASEDKVAIARPIFEACERYGIKAFLDEEHIAWGKSFTEKINTALGAARTVLAVVTPNSVNKDWPLAEMNSALALEVSGEKQVVVLLVGNPDLTRLPLIKTKKYLIWQGNADTIARELQESIGALPARAPPPLPAPVEAAVPPPLPAAAAPVVPKVPPTLPPMASAPTIPAPALDTRQSLLARLLSVRKLDS